MSKFYGYNYRKRHFICGSADGTQTNYPVMFKIYMDRPFLYGDGGNTVNLNGHSLSNLLDVRFYNATGTKLDYWIETSTADIATNRWAYVWVEIDSIPTTGCLIDIVYGKANDAGESNGDNTFSFFDHFDGASLDAAKWTTTSNTTVSQASSIATISTTTSNTQKGIYSNSTFGLYYSVRARWKFSNQTGYFESGFDERLGGGSKYCVCSPNPSTDKWMIAGCNTGSESYDSTISTDTSYHITQIYRFSASGVAFWLDNVDTTKGLTQIPQTALPILFSVYDTGTPTIDADWVAILKYTTNPPTHGDYGNEEGDYPLSYKLTTPTSKIMRAQIRNRIQVVN